MYHYVRELANSRYPRIKGLDYALFKEHIRFMQKKYTFIAIEELIAGLDSGQKLPENGAILTFDDGYSDHFDFVFPLLDANRIQGCFYPAVQAVRERKLMDVNKIHYIVALVEDEDVLVKQLHEQLDILRKDFELEDNDTYWQLYGKAILDTPKTLYFKRMLQDGLKGEARTRALDAIFSKVVKEDEKVIAAELYMNEDQMRCMISHGMHFGIHGYSHTRLHTLSPEQQEKEIQTSIDFLTDHGVRKETMTICYPYGSFDDNTIRISKEKGCKLGIAVEMGVGTYKPDVHSRYAIPRYDANDITAML
jgi:peptidoglycan/xylan/chitin deacetylase (PgdA/CDA1 family)